MKAYTNLQQSKKLAEILPLESADMCYVRAYFKGKQSDWFIQLGRPIKSDDVIPCWSLAALLGALPILDNRSPVIPKTFDGKYRVVYHSTACERGIFTHDYDNPIDACYEMIIKLHELKML